MKTVDVDDVLKILHRYGKYIFVTDDKKYSSMVDEIANLKGSKEEPYEDAVSREEVLDLCDSTDPEYKVVHFKEDIECLPPVNPQPKIGYWITTSYWYSNYCSNCNCKSENKTNYCPNCGAKMVEVQERSDKE